MSRISNEQIIEIRNSINIVDVVSEYVPLVQKGKNYFGVCPFHDDHNPSMSVSPEKQIYTCFVCGATGNVFTFLMEYEHISFMEAVKKIADKLHINIDIGQPIKKNNSMIDKYYDMYDLSMKYYQNNIKTTSGKDAINYLNSRNINDEIIKEFGIGISLTGDKIYQMLKANKFDDKSILESGLCNVSDNGIYDVFSKRIMFPLWDMDGKVIAFSGRIYNTLDTSKYVNSKESPIFKKGHLLYNYHRVREFVRKEGYIIIVEGFMDVIALYKVGIKNVIATMGTAITNDQAHLIKKLSSNVVLMFDGDKAGNKATIACSEELIKLDVVSKIVRLEDNLDPDEYINEYGVDRLKEHINNPISLIDYKMLIYKDGKNLNNSEDISNYINEVIKEINLVNDKIVKEVAIQKLSRETGVSTETLDSLIQKESKTNQKPVIIKKPEVKIKDRYRESYERLLFYMLRHKEVIRIVDESDVFIPDKEYRYLACEIISYYNKYHNIEIADFITYLEDKKELTNTLNKIMILQLPEEYLREEIDDYIKVLNEYTIDMEIKRLEGLLKTSISDIDKAEIVNKIIELKKGVDIDGNN
jgi:DNA primase